MTEAVDRRQVKPWGEVVDELPMLSTAERRALRASVEEHGVIYPVLVLPDGRIIDGHNRWEASNGQAPYKVLDVSDEDGRALALALNLFRRQLSPEQVLDVQGLLKRNRDVRHETLKQMRDQGRTQQQIAAAIGVSQATVSNWEAEAEDQSVINTDKALATDLRVSIPKVKHKEIVERREAGEPLKQIAADFKVSPERIGQIIRVAEHSAAPVPSIDDVPMPTGKYRCIVMDPPWQVQKIEREVFPEQGKHIDYPTMSVEEMRDKLPVMDLADPDGCHLYLWVTQKYLPSGLQLAEAWGFRYQCLMTWVKPFGFTPYSWMYSTEHVIFARMGSLPLERNGLKLHFEAQHVRDDQNDIIHSAKPDVFYERVLLASPGPRLEMFSRRDRDGFTAWGNEAGKLQAAYV